MSFCASLRICWFSLRFVKASFVPEKDFKWRVRGGVKRMQQRRPSNMPAVPFQDEMLFCDSCDRGFHMECCDPPLSRMPKGEVFTLSGFSVSLSAVISKPFLHTRPYGAVTQHTERQRWLIRSFACISNYFSIPGEICYLWITVLTLQRGL